MLVRCPKCREAIRLTDFSPEDRVVRYLCPGCEDIVPLDLVLDEVTTTGAATTFHRVRSGRTVLVADDSPARREIVADILRGEGHKVLIARDGRQALEDIRACHPDLVVMNLMLPKLASFDLLREVRSDPRLCATPVMVVGSVYKPQVVSYLHRLGADGFLDGDRLVETLSFRVNALLGSPAPAPPAH